MFWNKISYRGVDFINVDLDLFILFAIKLLNTQHVRL